MKYRLIAFALLASCCGPANPPFSVPDPPIAVTFSPAVSDNVLLIWSQFEVEIVLCMEGRWRLREMIIKDFRLPHHVKSSPVGCALLHGETCGEIPFTPGLESMAFFHTHPGGTPRMPRGLPRNCFLSKNDIISWVSIADRYPVAIVMCSFEKAAWWHITQIDTSWSIILPMNDQWVIWNTNTGGFEK